MTKKYPILIGFSFFFLYLIQTPVYNQFEASPVEKSDQKILYQGKTYYLHTVKPGHTLYSICKAYGVTRDEIAAANPGVVLNPLSVGLALKIPVAGSENPVSTKNGGSISHSDDNFIYHTVQPKENAYYLHLKYNVSLEDIYKYNPGAESGLQTGQIIRIPKQHQLEKTESQPELMQERVINYSVKQGDTLYRIAETYGLTVEDILNANADLRWGLKVGQIIQIPVTPDFSQLELPTFDSIYRVTNFRGFNEYQCDSIAKLKIMRPAIKVALLLPFYANEIFTSDTLSNIDTLSGQIRVKQKIFKGRAALEMYEGTLLALDSLKKTNHSVSLFVYDTEADSNKVRHILRDLDVIEPDLIIGPFAPENVRILSVYSFERKIPFVPPLVQDDSDLLSNPYLFKVIPSELIMYRKYIEYITSTPNQNFILITKKNLILNREAGEFRNMIFNQISGIPETDSVSFSVTYFGDSLQHNLSKLLMPDRTNSIVIFSSFEPEVINALSQLHFLQREYPIRAFGLPVWQKFDNLRIDVVHELQTTMYSPFFIDYSEHSVKEFIYKCRTELHSEPYKTTSKGNGINYTYLGYDITMFFIQAIQSYEENLCDCVQYRSDNQLLTNYYFRRTNPQQGFINTGINFVTFQTNYLITKTREP